MARVMKRLYLDANGSMPASRAAQEKLKSLLELCGNPSSFHEHGRAVRMIIDEARAHIASAIMAKNKEVIFTSGASEANRLFVDALVKKAKLEERILSVLMSPFEHPSLYKPILEAGELGLIDVSIMNVDAEGFLDMDEASLRACDVLIMCQAHNETGIIPDLEKALQWVGPETLVMSDISQGLARLPLVSSRVDVLTFSAQKMGGFSGAGALVLRGRATTLPAPWLGGGQERGFRPGTESTLLIAAFGEAARGLDEVRALHQKQALIRDDFENTIAKKLPVHILGQHAPRLANTSALCFFNADPDALRIACDLHGLSVGFGAACSGLAPSGSFALKRLGLSLHEEKTCIRFSLPPDATGEDMQEAARRLLRFI